MIEEPKWDAEPAPTPRGWRRVKDFTLAVGQRISNDNISILAAGVAFYAFVAIPSALAIIVALYGIAFNPAAVQHHVAALAGVLPADVITIISGFLTTLAANPPAHLSLGLVIGLLVAVWSTQSSTSSMIAALNAVFQKQEDRGLVQFYATSLAITVCSILLMVIGLVLVGAVPFILHLLPLTGSHRAMAATLRWPLTFALIAMGIAGLYRYAPSRHGGERRWGLRGVVLATAAWIGASALFSFYVSNFASYNRTFGSLSAVVVLLLWLYLSSFVVLIGAELNAEIEGRKRRR